MASGEKIKRAMKSINKILCETGHYDNRKMEEIGNRIDTGDSEVYTYLRELLLLLARDMKQI